MIEGRLQKRGVGKKSLIPVRRSHMFTRVEGCASHAVIIREGRSLRRKLT